MAAINASMRARCKISQELLTLALPEATAPIVQSPVRSTNCKTSSSSMLAPTQVPSTSSIRCSSQGPALQTSPTSLRWTTSMDRKRRATTSEMSPATSREQSMSSLRWTLRRSLCSRMALNAQGLLGWTQAILTVTLLFGSKPMKRALLVLKGQ